MKDIINKLLGRGEIIAEGENLEQALSLFSQQLDHLPDVELESLEMGEIDEQGTLHKLVSFVFKR